MTAVTSRSIRRDGVRVRPIPACKDVYSRPLKAAISQITKIDRRCLGELARRRGISLAVPAAAGHAIAATEGVTFLSTGSAMAVGVAFRGRAAIRAAVSISGTSAAESEQLVWHGIGGRRKRVL